ncbi:unnamed protein product [Bursaphelenchus xylophilus]|uniref:(pine wood nematode) hypothetical protein n=1 Tax=Bursaphelenchus xylophilus TaxID=6326 RepID=A0A1I7SLC8_BURXY|nr:unnamed protein product [Bursaphelenchus xylophilus]CAG9129495.1 unnamed protein product [Bursaphelenchus xylophilus]
MKQLLLVLCVLSLAIARTTAQFGPLGILGGLLNPGMGMGGMGMMGPPMGMGGMGPGMGMGMGPGMMGGGWG